MHASKIAWMGAGVALAARLAFAQATLPTSWTGPWERGAPPAGWTFSGLGVDLLPDYDGINDGAAKLDSTGDFISIGFSGSAASVTYWTKGLTFSGSTFRVEQSIDGTNWTELAAYTTLTSNATFRTDKPSAASRHVRFLYAEKITGNVGLDGISIAALGDFVQPVIGTFVATGGTATVSILESATGRVYALERTAALAAAPPVIWTQTDSKEGGGGALDLHDLAATNAAGCYRVRDITP